MADSKRNPQRMCIGCRTVYPKKDMLRVVRSPNNEYFVDITGKSPGRGAYICRNKECFHRAVKEHGFEKAFKNKMETAIYEALRKEVFPEAEESVESEV